MNSGPACAVNAFVEELRSRRPDCFVPYVDPDCGGVNARILMLFQDPGRKAAARGSGMLSISNGDPSAETVWRLLSEAAIPWSDVMLWNAVPWYTGGGNSPGDIAAGLCTLKPLTNLLGKLEVVVAFGGLATNSWRRAVWQSPTLRRFKHVATLHPSVRGQTRGGRQLMHIGRAQLVDDLMRAKLLLG